MVSVKKAKGELHHPEMKEDISIISAVVLKHYPGVQGIYLFGSHATGEIRPDSDMDIGLLLPHQQASQAGHTAMSDCCFELGKTLHRPVDLVNARLVSTVMQKEIIFGDLIYCADRYATDEFEMLTLSYYQRLNQERSRILDQFRKTGRAYAV